MELKRNHMKNGSAKVKYCTELHIVEYNNAEAYIVHIQKHTGTQIYSDRRTKAHTYKSKK